MSRQLRDPRLVNEDPVGHEDTGDLAQRSFCAVDVVDRPEVDDTSNEVSGNGRAPHVSVNQLGFDTRSEQPFGRKLQECRVHVDSDQALRTAALGQRNESHSASAAHLEYSTTTRHIERR